MELVNHILSFRQTHPVAKIIKDAYDAEMRKVEDEDFYMDIQYGTFMEIGIMYGEDYGVFKKTIFGICCDDEDDDAVRNLSFGIVEFYDKVYYDYGVTIDSPLFRYRNL